ncbi:hypothetical protein VIGAN_08308300 [Vigna angularis var. angularis]|nr:hypothetical protein VIGAN_08308300 [Vigna angularis var. angularis]
MDDDACNHLQTLWEVLETCGFELSWLKLHVKSVLGMKTCVEKVLVVKRLEENVTTLEKILAILEMEAKTLKTKVIEAKVGKVAHRRTIVSRLGATAERQFGFDSTVSRLGATAERHLSAATTAERHK